MAAATSKAAAMQAMKAATTSSSVSVSSSATSSTTTSGGGSGGVAGGELFVMAAYLSGAVCIVLFTLALGWIIVWKCVLSKMPFVQELFDLKPGGGGAGSAPESGPPLSFQERVAAARRKRESSKFK